MSFAQKWAQKVEKHLCAETCPWNDVRRGDQRLRSYGHPIFSLTQKWTPNSTSTKFLSPSLRKTFRVYLRAMLRMLCCHNSTSAHKAAATVQWLDNPGCNSISVQDWPVYSPDLSFMDFSINGIFQTPISEAEGQQCEWIETSNAQGGLKDLCRFAS